MTSTDTKIYVTGHHGMVGRAIMRSLLRQGHTNFVTRTEAELDLTHQATVDEFFVTEKPTQVYVVATPTQSAQANVIDAAFRSGVEKLLLLGSSDNGPYSASQGVDYRSVMHADLYGPGDNYHPDNSHVIPTLIRRFHEAKVSQTPSLTIGGSGTSRHQSLYIDDIAAASVFVMNQPSTTLDAPINVGFSSDIGLKELALAIGKTVGYQGVINFDSSQPDGSQHQSMDSSPINVLGWSAQVGLDAGLTSAYQDFLTSPLGNA